MSERRASQIRGTVSGMLICFMHAKLKWYLRILSYNEPTVIVEINAYLNPKEENRTKVDHNINLTVCSLSRHYTLQ